MHYVGVQTIYCCIEPSDPLAGQCQSPCCFAIEVEPSAAVAVAAETVAAAVEAGEQIDTGR